MTARIPRSASEGRHGITLLEVLISIGILAIGLGSVVALIPAGQSQASRAVVLDRAAALAANALADAATFGLLLPTAVTNGSVRPLVVDTAGTVLVGCANGGLCPQGMYSPAAPMIPASPAFHQLFMQSRDDVVIGSGTTPDDLPVNVFSDGIRGFEGRMSCLLCLLSGAPGAPEVMSAVVFHRRDPTFTTLDGVLTSGTLRIPAAEAAKLGSRLVSDVIKPGVVVFTPGSAAPPTPPRLHQVTSARIETVTPVGGGTDGFYRASMTFSTGVAIPTSLTPVVLQFLPDSVGLAERPFVPESPGGFAQ